MTHNFITSTLSFPAIRFTAHILLLENIRIKSQSHNYRSFQLDLK